MGYLADHPNELCVGDQDEHGNHISRKPTLLEIQQELDAEPTADDKREQITSSIYKIADLQTEQLRSNYSVTEAVRWTEDREAIALSNWSHFDARAGSTMTGQQYAETRVIPKITAGNIFLDKVIAKRTDLIVALTGAADEDLDSFDYTSMWDDSADYVLPPPEIVTSTAWAQLMASIPWNIKLF